MTLVRRSITSAKWNVAVSAAQVGVLVARSILLTRWLAVADFGVYALGTAVIGITQLFIEFGLNEAFLHRAPETEDEEAAAAVQFTVRLMLTAVWTAVLLTGAWLFTSGAERLTLVVLTLAHAVHHPLSLTPVAILTRRVVHRRLALRQLLVTVLTSLVAIGLAWQGAGLWALLATDITQTITSLVVLYGWRAVWWPRLAWSPAIVRYYFSFGRRAFLATFLLRTMDEIDDIYTRVTLGLEAAGFYARAFQFAIYPRMLLAFPLSTVTEGTYSELKGDRARLSKAFYRTNAVIVRSGFLFAGVLALTAPEFVPLLLTDKWSPMVRPFQLMLLFALLDPLRATIANLFNAVGKPEKVVRARVVQFVILMVGLVTLGPLFGIEGVAVAANIMLLVGIGLLLWQARTEVDFNPMKLFAVPLLALGVGSGAALLALAYAGAGVWWWTGGIKFGVFTLVYGGVLVGLEYRELNQMGRLILAGK